MAAKQLDPAGNLLPPGMLYRGGVYYVRHSVHGRRLKKSTGKRDYKSAMRRYHEIMLAWNNQESGWAAPERAPVLKDYWATYRESWVSGVKTPVRGTKDIYRDDSLIAAALFDLGHRRLTDFTPTMAQKWKQKRLGMFYQRKKGGTRYPITEGTVSREIALLQTIFGKAIADGHIEKNAWLEVDRGNYGVRDRVLLEEEQAKLEAQLSPKVQRLVNFLLGTGLRIQEALDINPETDLNLAKRAVVVTRKTRGLRKKVQTLPLFDPMVSEILKAQLEAEGTLWTQSANRYRHIIAEAAERAGIDHVSPHTLRHTFATRYLQRGGNIYTLSKLLGHASVKMTEKIYAHLLTEDLGLLSANISLGVGVEGKVLPFKKALTVESA